MHKRVTILMGCLVCSVVWARDYYVAPDGNDNYTGTLERPFATLYRARDVVRKLVAADLQEDVTMYMRGGTYRLPHTLVLGLPDSGTDKHSITYRAYPGERPILSSGVPIVGWEPCGDDLASLPKMARGQVWVATIPKSLDRFFTLYDAQGRLPRAQGPGFVPTLPITQEQRSDPMQWYESRRLLHYPAGALKDWTNLEDVEIIARPRFRWMMNILPLAWVDEAKQVARTALPSTYALVPVHEAKSDGTMWIENVLEILDQPGEWVLNTRERKLYLWPRHGEKPVQIVAPCLRELIRVEGLVDVQGPTDVPVRGLHFTGLTFTEADRDLWTLEDAAIQHDWDFVDKANGLLRFRGAEHCRVEHCTFRDSGGNAIRLDLHSQHITITGNEIRHLGAGGIMLIGYGPGTKDVNKHNTITNNHIHHCGTIYWHSHGIVVWQSGHNRIAHNTLHHMPRKAICLSGVRTYSFQPCNVPWRECNRTIRWYEVGERGKTWTWLEILPFMHTRNNIVEYNEAMYVLQMLGDGAAINISGAGDGNVIRRNFVHDIYTHESASACYRADNYQRNTLFEENVALRSNIAGFVLSGGAPGIPGANHLINNVVCDVTSARLINGCVRLWYKVTSVDGSIFERNIFYQPVDNATFYRLADVPLDYIAKCRVGNNILYDRGVDQGKTSANLEAIRSVGVALTDRYADPCFVDWRKGDFRFRPESPAPALGIKEVGVSRAGITKDFPRELMD